MAIKEATHGKLDQGTIFNCALAENYPGKKVNGIIVTARCDLAQNKFQVLNYVPVVSIYDWLHVDGLQLLIERISKNVDGEKRNFIKELGIADSVLIANSFEKVAGDAIKLLESRLQRKTNDRFVSLKSKVAKIGQLSNGDCSSLFDEFQKTLNDVIVELLSHKLSGYYYLHGIEDDSGGNFHVALLRELRFMPREIALRLAGGLVLDATGGLDKYINIAADTMACPVGQLQSPNVEHFLQSFGLLFSRIGIEDNPRSHAKEIIDLVRIKI